jgi:hypothetical protein
MCDVLMMIVNTAIWERIATRHIKVRYSSALTIRFRCITCQVYRLGSIVPHINARGTDARPHPLDASWPDPRSHSWYHSVSRRRWAEAMECLNK